jgi:hypothetical protein
MSQPAVTDPPVLKLRIVISSAARAQVTSVTARGDTGKKTLRQKRTDNARHRERGIMRKAAYRNNATDRSAYNPQTVAKLRAKKGNRIETGECMKRHDSDPYTTERF